MDEKDILSLLQEDKESKVHILPSGHVPPNPAELVGSEQMRRTLRIFYTAFDYIVLDSPPIVTCTDGVLISRLVDGVILVIKGGETSRDLARRSQQLLREVNAKILGVVLNKMDRTSSKYYYTNYYKHYYYESESEELLES
jgi:capsular exopolysaccharide synthesis family protein